MLFPCFPPQEVAAARTICERGVLLVGTAHGSSLAGLLRNPELRPLLGGLAAVTLGDAEAKASNAGHKVRCAVRFYHACFILPYKK